MGQCQIFWLYSPTLVPILASPPTYGKNPMKKNPKALAIGYYREDGDFAILSTVNNNDDHLSTEDYMALVQYITDTFSVALEWSIMAVDLDIVPDYVTTTPSVVYFHKI
jgi:hypothetical protein